MLKDSKIMLTIILKHDQSKTIEEIRSHLKRTGFCRDFPPEGTKVIWWVVAMSFGFVIQVEVEPDKLRTLNLYIEQKAWGAFRYQGYLSYDFLPIAAQLKENLM